MDDLTAMKGPGKLIATLISDHVTTTQLLRFADGSVGISHDGAFVGAWEAGQTDECFETFLALGGARQGVGAIVLRLRDEVLRQSGLAEANVTVDSLAEQN
jgi:hypothetical protein